MIKLIDKFVRKLQRIKQKYRLSNIIYNVDGMVLTNVCDINFNSDEIIAKEIREHCKEKGFKIDKIFFFKTFSIEESGRKSNFRAKSKSRLVVMNNKDRYEAYLFCNSQIKITGKVKRYRVK